MAAINHHEPDMVPLDVGASAVTGMHASSVYKLRQALALDPPGTPVRVIEPYQMLGEIAGDLRKAVGIDVVGLIARKTMFGFPNEGWKEWQLSDGTPVLVPSGFNTTPEPNGDILMYPEGDFTSAPSGRMPRGGFYFDAIERQHEVDDSNLNLDDNLEEFSELGLEDLSHFEKEANRLYTETDAAILATFGGTAFGDIAMVPAPWLQNPKGIRGITEWYVSTIARRDFVYSIFEKQCEIGIKNLESVNRLVGDKVAAVFITGTDFGTQLGPFISVEAYKDLYQPFHKEVNNWIHTHTGWKSFIHSCGSVYRLLPEFLNSGFDVLNPVQCSAAEMEPARLKAEFGERFVFWGGAVDTQHTLPFGTPEQVADEVKARVETFAPGGGFVFNPVHNIQARVPIENLVTMFETFNSVRKY